MKFFNDRKLINIDWTLTDLQDRLNKLLKCKSPKHCSILYGQCENCAAKSLLKNALLQIRGKKNLFLYY